ncbi:MAG TPA: LLM class flavin-dependent oxidoreductase [Chloroflexota bacterium]
MEYGIFQLPTFHPEPATDSAAFYAALADQARRAEALGFGSYWIAEHHFHGFGGMIPSPQIVIPALAAQTTRLRFGTGVALLPFHNPLRLAEDYATVDVLTGGRFDFGVGLGFQKLEADNLGAPLDQARERFYEHLDVILRAWTSERLTYDSPNYHYDALYVLPKPVQQPHPPVWLAATATPESFRWAGERGYGMMTIGFLHDLEGLKERIDLYRQAYRAAGHPPEGERVLGTYHAYAGPNAAEAREAGRRGLEYYQGSAKLARELAGVHGNYAAFKAHAPVIERTREMSFEEMQAGARVIVGDPPACRETIARLREELGLTHLLFLFALGGLPDDQVLSSMDRFTDQVLGALPVT